VRVQSAEKEDLGVMALDAAMEQARELARAMTEQSQVRCGVRCAVCGVRRQATVSRCHAGWTLHTAPAETDASACHHAFNCAWFAASFNKQVAATAQLATRRPEDMPVPGAVRKSIKARVSVLH
jgi:hypothetical protein